MTCNYDCVGTLEKSKEASLKFIRLNEDKFSGKPVHKQGSNHSAVTATVGQDTLKNVGLTFPTHIDSDYCRFVIGKAFINDTTGSKPSYPALASVIQHVIDKAMREAALRGNSLVNVTIDLNSYDSITGLSGVKKSLEIIVEHIPHQLKK